MVSPQLNTHNTGKVMDFGHSPFKKPDKNDKGLKPTPFILIFLLLWFLFSLTFFV